MSRANVLIISDLHLGEDIKPGTLGVGALKQLVRVERALEAFLRHYAQPSPDARPWRLIVNGDMVDFLGMCLLPEGGDASVPLADDERVFGLGSHPRAARAKLERVFTRHPGVFRALADFVAAGHHLDIVVGNHDAEFHWPLVQDTFKQGLVRLAGDGAVGMTTRVTFHPWFYFEEDVAWVEHGHQYDAYCSFESPLAPAAETTDDPEADGQGELETNVATAAMRYFVNHVGGYHDGIEHFGVIGYVRLTCSRGARHALHLAQGFGTMCSRLVAAARRARSAQAIARRRARHRRKLAALASQFRVREDALDAIHELRRVPLVGTVHHLLGALLLDRIAVVTLAVVLVAVFGLSLPWLPGLGVCATIVLLAGLGAYKLQKTRISPDPRAVMRQVTRRILEKVRARYVIFGHTHEPVAEALEGGGMYFNTGTWMPHGAPSASEFTHVMIRCDDTQATSASLCAWRDGKSEPL